MRIFYFTISAALFMTFFADAAAQHVFKETFAGVAGTENGVSELDMSALDNKEGWIFDERVRSGPGCALMEKDATITLPAIPELIYNATVYFELWPWGETEDFTPCTISLSEGTLSHDKADIGVSGAGSPVMHGVTPETRITLTATHRVRLSGIYISYGVDGEMDTDGIRFSHNGGIYVEPLTVEIAPDSYTGFADDYGDTKLVYTTDGSEPTRFSTLYKGPVSIDGTSTLKVGKVTSYGTFYHGASQTYTYPVVAENIADYKSLPEGTFVKITLRDALVTYSEVHQAKGDIYGHTYIQDDSGAMGIVGWGGTPLKTNEILNGHLYGYGTGTDMFSSCQYTSFDNLVTGTLPVAPKEIGSIDEMLNDDNLSSIVSLDGVTLDGGYARKDGAAVKYIYAPTVSAPAAHISTRDARAASGDTYCITGILQKEQGEYQLMLLSAPVATDIDAVFADSDDGCTILYDLSGRRMDCGNLSGGIYITGQGRKIVVR